jgi:hypothetical protein
MVLIRVGIEIVRMEHAQYYWRATENVVGVVFTMHIEKS